VDNERSYGRYRIQHDLTSVKQTKMKNLKDKVAFINGGIRYATAGVLNEKSAKVISTAEEKKRLKRRHKHLK